MKPADQVFGAAFLASPIGIALENLEGQPLFVNPALCSMLGFSEEEMCNKHCVDFSPAEDSQKDWALFQQLRAGLIDRYRLDKRFFRRDGSLLWGRLNISLLNDTTPMVVAFVEDITAEKAVEEELARSRSTLSQRLILAQEEERARIARELHDDINQRISMLAARLDAVQQNLLFPAPEAEQELVETVKEIGELSEDIQALSHRLYSAKLDYLGLERAAASFCGELAKRSELQIEFQSQNVSRELSKDISLCLFRVLQEALQNAIKHSASRHFLVSLKGCSEEIELTVQDFGAGFDLDEALKGRGIGLMSMTERLRSVNGILSIDSQLRQGTTVQARAPLPSGIKSVGPGVEISG